MAEINENLISEPDTIKNSTYDDNWLFRIYATDLNELQDTMSEDEYNNLVENMFIMSNPKLVKRLNESLTQLVNGEIVEVSFEDLRKMENE